MPEKGQEKSPSSVIEWGTAKAVFVIGVLLSLFQMYTAGMVAMTAMRHRSVFLTCILVITFLTRPLYKRARKDRLNWALCVDLILIAVSVAVGAYIFIDLDGIFERQGDWSQWDIRVGIVYVLLVLEATRRVIGINLVCIAVLALVYGYFGPYMPELIVHKGYSIERLATTLSLTTEGIFGLPTGVAATFVFIFILFGSFLEKTGAGNFFIDLSYSITGRFSGGPAKTAVVASGFMGSVAGSAVANVVATGSFTIPMMKKIGYRPHVAAAIEAAASTGGQLMPPIMGAGAFLMAEFTQIPYLHIVKIAFIPAVLYFFSVIFFVHIEAQKLGIWGQPKEALPKLGETIKKGMHFIIPVGILITVLIMNYSPMMAGFIGILSVYFTALTRKTSRISFKTLLETLAQGAGLCRSRDYRRNCESNWNGASLFFFDCLSFTRDSTSGVRAGGLHLFAVGNGTACDRLLYRSGYPGRPRTYGAGDSAPHGAYDCLLVQPGRQRNAPCCPGIFRSVRNCWVKSYAHGVYLLEAGQRALYHTNCHGLSSPASGRARLGSIPDSRIHPVRPHRLCGLHGTVFYATYQLAGDHSAWCGHRFAHLGKQVTELYWTDYFPHTLGLSVPDEKKGVQREESGWCRGRSIGPFLCGDYV